jgi:hypothetical protein
LYGIGQLETVAGLTLPPAEHLISLMRKLITGFEAGRGGAHRLVTSIDQPSLTVASHFEYQNE